MKKIWWAGAMALSLPCASLSGALAANLDASSGLASKLAEPSPIDVAAKTPTDEAGVRLIANRDLRSWLEVDGERLEISGRLSLHLLATEQGLKDGMVEVKGFNLAYFKVPQAQISRGRTSQDDTGVLGFAVKHEGGSQYLEYDPASGRLAGKLYGYVDASYMAALGRLAGDSAKDDDLYETPAQSASLYVEIALDEALSALSERAKVGEDEMRKGAAEDVMRTKAGLRFEADIDAESDFDLPAYRIEAKPFELELEYAPAIYWIEVAKRLCVQPVRIGRLSWSGGWPYGLSVDYTGEGLSFGMPEVRNQWSKADVVFTVNDWVTVWQSGYWEMDTNGSWTSTEEANLMNEVDNDDCVEVFFIDDFVPESAHGGGATWGSGTAGTKIITSDGNARGGIDETHLAHELGHSMGLRHPWSPATASAEPGSTGTLMCPSGWMNDNPKVNSQENEDKLSNPLFTFAFKFVTAGPDCADSGDCGACP
ncbi:hypothetical protein [Thiorhodococcus minor]|uniref:Matrixin family metalloprotease n=1 Tax=Thiorhodococcus minor TaxID=57489 RepID=A0A6M0K3J7_9GAMM|nr:hypothetical protein [Thiorhodococcus minor]NEV64300.1 hypothetical protein [Thiorhodococcus minor]